MYSIAYFSPTGNTSFLAKELKNQLNHHDTQLIDIVHNKGKNLQANEHLIILFSIHAFNAPTEVINFVRDIPKSIFKQVSIIAVGCNTNSINAAASLSVRDILMKKEYNIASDRVVAMPLTFVAKFSDEMCIKTISDSRDEIEKISKDIELNLIDKKEVSFGAKSAAFLGKSEKYAARLFGLELYATNKCISCGLCSKECPSKNIKEKNNKPKFGLKCSMCMRCIYNCPVNAISPRLSKFIPLKKGYHVEDYIK